MYADVICRSFYYRAQSCRVPLSGICEVVVSGGMSSYRDHRYPVSPLQLSVGMISLHLYLSDVVGDGRIQAFHWMCRTASYRPYESSSSGSVRQLSGQVREVSNINLCCCIRLSQSHSVGTPALRLVPCHLSHADSCRCPKWIGR